MDAELRERVRTSRALPSPPAVAVRLIELGEDPDTEIADVIEVLQTDPALSARILKVANSPFYGRRRRTDNLRQAVMLLGVNAVFTSALSLTLIDERSIASAGGRYRRHWTRMVHAAVAAQALAREVPGVDDADAFLAALLQDIGVLVVMKLEPATYAELPERSTHRELTDAELDHLGADHAEIGAELLTSWNLPSSIVDSVRSSHRLAAVDHPEHAIRAVVALSGIIADGIHGDAGAIERAVSEGRALLGLDVQEIAAVLDEIGDALPELAELLNADTPDSQVLAEMAHDVIVTRQAMVESRTTALQGAVEAVTARADADAASLLDPLTGLAGRRRCDDVVDEELAIAADHDFPLSVIVLDLDDFAHVNDRYGRKVGDELLELSAQRISSVVRDGDLVARRSGDRFAVVLPGTDETRAETAAARLVQAFRDRRFVLGTELSIAQSISAGVATFDALRAYRDGTELIRASETALAAAKHAGKDVWMRGDSFSAEAATEPNQTALIEPSDATTDRVA